MDLSTNKIIIIILLVVLIGYVVFNEGFRVYTSGSRQRYASEFGSTNQEVSQHQQEKFGPVAKSNDEYLARKLRQ